MSLTKASYSMIAGAPYNALDYGPTITSSTINAAILAAASNGGGKVVIPNGSYTLTSTIIIPSNVALDFNWSDITGPGIGSATDLFQSGYYSSGAVITNIGTVDQSHMTSNASVSNANIKNCGKVFRLFNWWHGSTISNIFFTDCASCVYAENSYYSQYLNLFSQGNANNSASAAYYFSTFVNVENVQSVFVTGRTLGFQISNPNGLKLLNCSAEACVTGISVISGSGPLEFDTCYIEGNTSYGVSMYTAGPLNNCTFNNCWFYQNGTAILDANNAYSNTIVNENCYFLGNTSNYVNNDNINAYGIVNVPPGTLTDTGLPVSPTGYTLGEKERLNYEIVLNRSSDGLIAARTKVYGQTVIPFQAEGDAGRGLASGIPFTTNTIGSGGTASIVITTRITARTHSSLLVYNFTITDNTSTYPMYGFIFGTTVNAVQSSGKTISVGTDGNGQIQITLSAFNNASGGSSISGVLRHM